MHEYNPSEFIELIEPGFSFLLQEGYSSMGVRKEEQNLLGRSVTVEWENGAIKRIFRAKYIEPKPHAPMGTLIIEIKNLEPPKLDQDDYTTMTSCDVMIPRLSDLSGSFKARIIECVSLAKIQLRGVLKPVLNGEVWEPSSLDWGGLK